MTRGPVRREAGAALAVSLVILVILTLLGIAALRSSRLELRLSQNTESRITALQNAQATADAVTDNTAVNLPIETGPGYVGCYVSSASVGAPTAPTLTPSCSSNTLSLPTGDPDLLLYRYAQVKREDPEFLTTAALRGGGTSGRSYDYARFTVTAGFDNSGNGMGASEVGEGVLRVHVKPTGVVYQ